MRRTLVIALGLLAAVAAPVAGAAVATSAATKHGSEFKTPTHNIGCNLLGGQARCDIGHHTYALPPRPKSCPHIVNFGQGIFVGKSGKGRIVCAGDTAMDPGAPVLAYGSSDHFGAFSCQSRTDGVTCTNLHTGHGFFISIQSYRLF
jgi:hypothetical protein